MHLNLSKMSLVTLIVAASSAIAAPAFADGKNEVRAVTFDEDGGITRVHVRAATTPTFTVYKLERPSRVVIDLPQASLAESVRGAHESSTTLTAGTWAVGTIAAQELDESGAIVRVIVTLARPGRYDVKTEGNELVVMVNPRDPKPESANPADLAAARAQADSARAQADTARAQTEAAKRAQVDAEHANATAQADAMKAKSAATAAQADAERLRKLAADQTARADAAQRAAETARKQGEQVATADVERAKAQAAAANAQAAAAKQAAMAAQSEADRTRTAAELARREALAQADAAKAEAAAAKIDATRTHAEAELAKRDAANAKAQAAAANDASARSMAQVAAANDDAARSRAEVAAARNEIQKIKSEAQAARSEADAARIDAEHAKTAAAADKRAAETERAQAERMLHDAKAQLATLDQRTASAQEMQDKARAASAAAEAREQAARTAVADAATQRAAAEAAAKRAAEARDQSSSQAKSERDRLSAEAAAAELRLADAKRLADAAEARRMDAETAAGNAKHDLERTKTALATVEQQRSAAEIAASDAARKRSDAEAAAGDASRRRAEAETAAQAAARKRAEAETAAADAAQRRTEADAQRVAAESQRKAAEDAAKQALVAARAADKQRAIAETAAKSAVGATHEAEISLAALTAKRAAAERAADELDARSKAEAAAQADLAAAKARKASDDDLARARADATRLVAERKQAEDELATRRKAVAAQQAEADRLKSVASEARDAADREENRRAQLAEQRATEERELARIKAQKSASIAMVAQAPMAAPVAAPVATPVAAPVVAPAPAAPAAVRQASVKSIDFRGDADRGEVDIAIAGNATVQVGEVSANYAELIIDGAELAAKLERKLDVSKFGSPVRAVSSFHDRRVPNRVRLIAELADASQPTFDRDGDTVRWHFGHDDRSAQAAPEHHLSGVQNIQPTVVGGFGAASTAVTQQSVTQVAPTTNSNGRKRVYHGATVDFDFKDAPIHDLLRIIADTGHVNIIIPDDIDAKVTVRLKRVPWDQALEVILQSHGWWYRRDGNLYRISTRKQLDAEDEEENKRRAALIQAEAPEPEIITLNYANAEELRSKLEPLLSPKGKIETDPRTNRLIVNDVRGNRQRVQALALELDTQPPQISIEARVVEANSTFSRAFGIQWGGNALASAAGGNATGLLFPSSIGLTGANSDGTTNGSGVSTPSNFAINLPAATGNGEGGAIGMSLGSLAGNLNVNLRLSALEDTGTVRIISAPKITVLNGIEAKITQGTSIPIQVLSAAGTNTQFVQADLSLTVKPYVSQRDCAISMNLTVTKNEPDFANTGARGDPTILRKEAKTTMLVNDGDTTVLGGIYTRNTSLSLKKFPFLGDLPVIGWLFKTRQEIDNRTEVLVFITPKITNKASLHCQ